MQQVRSWTVMQPDGSFAFNASSRQIQVLIKQGLAIKLKECPKTIQLITVIQNYRENTISTEIYGNWKVLNPAGTLIFRTSTKRANWYLKRNLAKTLEEKTIQLTFEPKASGHAKDPHTYFLEDKTPSCVCCNKTENLTRHHVVPTCYRKFFPQELKSNNSFDIVVLCDECHEAYERHSQVYQKQLLVDSSYQPNEESVAQYKYCRRINSILGALQENGNLIPLEKRNSMLTTLSQHYKRDITLTDIAFLEYEEHGKQGESLAEFVVSKQSSLDNFIIQWRKHFLEHAKPKFLSKIWVDNCETVLRSSL